MTPTPTTTDWGLFLADYMQETAGGGRDPEMLRGLIAMMLESPATTPADALALVSWMAAFLPIVHAMLPDDDAEEGGPKKLTFTAVRMAAKAKVALELHTGLASETFIGRPTQAN